MKKVLLGTTALAAMGLLAGGAAQAEEEAAQAEVGPVSVGVGGYYHTAVGFVSGDAGENTHDPAVAQDIEIIVSGSTTLDNGITVGMRANIEGNGASPIAKWPSDVDSFALDERWLYFNGPFGNLQVGSIESAAQQMTNFAPGAAGIFGVNSPFFLFTPGFESYIATYNDGIGDEDSAKLVYFTPAVNGFRLGASFAPSDSHQGQYGGNVAGSPNSDYKNQWSVGAEFSTDVGDASLRAMVGYDGYEYDGMCDSNVAHTAVMPATGMYRLGDKMQKIGAGDLKLSGNGKNVFAPAYMKVEAGDGNYKMEIDGSYVAAEGGDYKMYHQLTPLAAGVVDKARMVWGGDPTMNPLLVTSSDKYMGMDGKALDRPRLTGSAISLAKMYEFMDPSMMTGGEAQNCSPQAVRYGATISAGAFAFGGGALHTDVSNDHGKLQYDLGVSYSVGAYSLGLQWAHAETEMVGGSLNADGNMVGHGEVEQDRYAINATYVLGPGISLQAQADTGEQSSPGMGEADWNQVMFGTSISF